MSAAPLLQFDAIEKRFGSVKVLKQVSFALPTGHTLGLVGENGAGKSTLMNVLGGNVRPDGGGMRLHGRAYAPRDPGEAARHGVAFIHQELNLFSNLTVAENLCLPHLPRVAGLPLVNRAEMHRRAAAWLGQVGLPIAPGTPLDRLSTGERQLVEIARALGAQAQLIILDEPTTSLSDRETRTLFALLGRLRAQGISMIYISHALGDVLQLCDDVVVLRDGEVVGAGPRSEFSPATLVAQMVGRSLSQLFPARVGKSAPEPLLELSRVSQPGLVRDISLTVQRGEILGLFGLMGAGRSELARIIFGLEPCARGSVKLQGRDLIRQPVHERIQAGLALLTESRREDGLCLEASIADNIALASLRSYTRTPLRWLHLGGIGEAVRQMRAAVRLTPSAGDQQPVKTLSGGNQQKVVLAKWLLARPRVLILDEPTRGIDVGAKYEIYQLINQLADQGAGVLLISSELEELLGLCDRLLVMSRGEIKDELPRARFDRERILRSALQVVRPAA